MKIAVIMSAYNGEKYIAQQIDSILQQDIQGLLLIIRDDGSADSTPQIIRLYADNNSNVIFLNERQRKNLGIRDSFLTALKMSLQMYPHVAYFAFSDQDDIWKPKKISRALSLMCSKNKCYGNGRLYYSNKTFVDKTLNIIQEERIKYYGDYYEILWHSLAAGCTMVIDRQLAEIVLLQNFSIYNDFMHDSWIYRIAKMIGSHIIFDEESNIYYRQHDNNIVGMKGCSLHHSFFYVITHFISYLFTPRKHMFQKFVKEIDKNFSDYIGDECKSINYDVIRYNTNIKSKFRLILCKEMKKRNITTRLFWTYKILFNMI